MSKKKMNIELDQKEHVNQWRTSEAAAIKGVSHVTICAKKNDGTFTVTSNNLIVDDEKFKNWKPKR